MTQTKKQDRKIAKVMKEFKKKKLSIGKSDKKVKNRKQAIAIALREAGVKQKRSKNGKTK
jgi:hypothetical protein|tara:strand:+ start:1678 stop:1857 length:180 start_codon:yes stop_codon:yes gene_type:complete